MSLNFVILHAVLLFLGASCQRGWSSLNTAYNLGFSNSWNSNNGYSAENNNNNFGFSGSGFSNFGGRPKEKPSLGNDKSSNWRYETSSNSGKIFEGNSNKPVKTNIGNSGKWQADALNKWPNENMSSSFTNLPNSSKWNTSSNNVQSNMDENSNLSFLPWGSNSGKPSGQISSQNSRPGVWDSNSSNNKKLNGNTSGFGNEDNFAYSSWSSDNKKKIKPTSNSNNNNNDNNNNNNNNWETNMSKSYKKTGISKWAANKNKKPKEPLEPDSWDADNTFETGRETNSGGLNAQNERKSSSDTSILDELDKNDWYFGKESNYPKPPFRSSVNIDVSELWNFDKNRKFNQTNRGNRREGNIYSNSNRRRNRQIKGIEEDGRGIQCECVNVVFCEEQDMIITPKDIKYDSSLLREFRCKDLTDVCCINPKKNMVNRADSSEERERLRCGQRRTGENPFENFGGYIAEPGEFPWSLKLENSEINCGASLIHHSMALTAAHCVTGKRPDEFMLKAGIWNSNNEPSQSRHITEIITHPNYNSQNPRNDIALLILETPFELTDNVNTICLPVTNDKWDSNQCIVAGWRPQEIQGKRFEVLEKGIVNYLPQAECQNIMLVTDFWRNYVLHDSFMCGLEKTERRSCMGDEGGFVICPSKRQPKTYLQIGIVSKGMNCDNFGRPGIFTNVLKFLDWINRIYFELGLFDDIGSLQ